MFKSIQKYLLLNHPILWNTKIVPAIIFALLFHILFFILGYFEGAIDFTNENMYYEGLDAPVIIFFSVLVTILFFVVWFVYYFRNNAYKSFYRQEKSAIYKEWLIIVLISFLNVTYSVSFLSGQTIRQRSYFSKEETQQRCETISMASVFIVGSFHTDGSETKQIDFNKKRYPVNSLFNKNLDDFFYEETSHKLEIRVKKWMQQDDRQAIRKLMDDYLAIMKEHGLKGDIDADQWFKLTYNYPWFVKYEDIGRSTTKESSIQQYDGSATYFTHGDTTTYKYNLPHLSLMGAYGTISRAWSHPIIEDGLITFILYIAISIGMLIFSFRKTSGRSWLIALISAAVLFILTGILSAISHNGNVFLAFWLFVMLAIFTYFALTVWKNRGKELSGIFVNLMLWSLAGFLPIIYGLLMEYYNNPKYIIVKGEQKYTNTPEYYWLDANGIIFSWVNILIVIALMYFITLKIRKWKGLAES